MTNPTPTPDTLRAAVEALATAWESKASRPPRGQLTESVQAAFRACAVNLRAALAASPAPTDSPPRLGVCTYDAAPHPMFDECADWRPAAVTAPREDERAAVLAYLDRVDNMDPSPRLREAVAESRAALAAAAPAVERATPDPDTLANRLGVLLAGSLSWRQDGLVNVLATARALIAAGVTLNETATTPTQEDA